MTAKDYRYVSRTGKHETQLNLHVKEMIEVIKNEEIKKEIYVKAVKLSTHAFKRFKQIFNVNNLATANRITKDMLKNAMRIGAVLAYDGRVNVMYALNNTAFFMSPDLKTVVTVNKYQNELYKPISKIVNRRKLGQEDTVKLHLKFLKNMEEQERVFVESMLKIEEKVSEAVGMYSTILEFGKGFKRKQQVKEMISEYNLMLKQEGWKLFNLKVEQRHVCKSLASII